MTDSLTYGQLDKRTDYWYTVMMTSRQLYIQTDGFRDRQTDIFTYLFSDM